MKIVWHNETRKLGELVPYEHNPRQLTEKQYKDLRQSLEKFDLAEIPAINTDNTLIAGHQRIKIMLELYGANHEIDVRVPNRELTEDEFREYLIRSNKNSGNWDFDILANAFDIDDLLNWGFEDFELSFDTEAEEASEDDFEGEPPAEPTTKLGDLYELNEHRVLCGDSTDSDAVARLMDGKQSELLFTSPPYSDMRDYGGDKDLSIDHLKTFIRTFYPYAKYQVINLGLQRKDNEVVEYWQDYIQEAKDCGYKFLSWNVWNRDNASSIGNQTAMFPIWHEWMFVFGRENLELNRTRKNKTPGSKAGNNRQKDGSTKKGSGVTQEWGKIGTVQSIGVADGKLHPAMFPVELPFEYIQAMTKEGDIVTESFLGSGTTLIACQQLNRTCYGQELDEGYCDIIIERWVKYMKDNNKPFTVKRNGIDVTKEYNG